MNAIARIESTAVIPFDDVARMGQVMAQSKLFGIQNEQQAIALMLLCQSENLHPATAMRDYHLIQGRPALKADAMLARFQAAGGKVKWTSYTDERVEATFTHPAGDSITIEWTPQRVAKAKISNDMHNKYPRQMLKARCISEGIRAIYPGVLSGMYAPEELQEISESPAAAPALPAAHPSRTDALKAQMRTITPETAKSVHTAYAVMAAEEVIDPDTGEVLPADPLEDPNRALILALNECATLENLQAHRPAVAALKGDAKRRAVEAWKSAEARLAAAPAPAVAE